MSARTDRIRTQVLRMAHESKGSHVGGSLSVIEILDAVYEKVRDDPAVDVVISKGHAASAVYATIHEFGIADLPLDEYCRPGSRLIAHVSSEVEGVSHSSGSLGHGLAIACGVASVMHAVSAGRVFAVLSDGECAEGAVWEAAQIASDLSLGRLTALIDANGLQSFGPTPPGLSADRLARKFRSFGWLAITVDGHSPSTIRDAMREAEEDGRPTAIVAATLKGKGVSFMEGRPEFHYRPPTTEELAQALRELGGVLR